MESIGCGDVWRAARVWMRGVGPVSYPSSHHLLVGKLGGTNHLIHPLRRCDSLWLAICWPRFCRGYLGRAGELRGDDTVQP